METTNGSITTQGDGFTVQNMLFTYNEEEIEEQKLNKLNAGLILKPQFLTLDYAMLHNGYNLVETALYGFIRFFLTNNEKFYCTDEQLADLLCVSENTVGNAIKKLKDNGLIEITHKIKSGGGKVRFIRLTKSVFPNPKICASETQNLGLIYNKIIKNKKEIYKEKKSTSVNELVEACMNDERINTVFSREDIEEWLNYKERKKQQYSTVKSCIQQLVIAKRQITLGQPKLDISKRFNFAVNYAIGKGRDGIHWYEDTEKEYLATKKDFYPNPNLDEQ